MVKKILKNYLGVFFCKKRLHRRVVWLVHSITCATRAFVSEINKVILCNNILAFITEFWPNSSINRPLNCQNYVKITAILKDKHLSGKFLRSWDTFCVIKLQSTRTPFKPDDPGYCLTAQPGFWPIRRRLTIISQSETSIVCCPTTGQLINVVARRMGKADSSLSFNASSTHTW